jgi:hypothetical protein
VDLTRKDSRGLTPLQTALGQAGGFGFGGREGVVREETAKVIAELTTRSTCASSRGTPSGREGASGPDCRAAPGRPLAGRRRNDDPNNK